MGYRNPDLKGHDDGELIAEMEARGYVVFDEDTRPEDLDLVNELERLYLDYMTIGGNFFHKRLREFFNKNLNKTLV